MSDDETIPTLSCGQKRIRSDATSQAQTDDRSSWSGVTEWRGGSITEVMQQMREEKAAEDLPPMEMWLIAGRMARQMFPDADVPAGLVLTTGGKFIDREVVAVQFVTVLEDFGKTSKGERADMIQIQSTDNPLTDFDVGLRGLGRDRPFIDVEKVSAAWPRMKISDFLKLWQKHA